MTDLYLFLESKKWYLLFKGSDVTWKPSIWTVVFPNSVPMPLWPTYVLVTFERYLASFCQTCLVSKETLDNCTEWAWTGEHIMSKKFLICWIEIFPRTLWNQKSSDLKAMLLLNKIFKTTFCLLKVQGYRFKEHNSRRGVCKQYDWKGAGEVGQMISNSLGSIGQVASWICSNFNTKNRNTGWMSQDSLVTQVTDHR